MLSSYCIEVIATITAAISLFSDGLQFGWSAPTIPLLLSDNSPIPLTKNDTHWLELIYFLGAMFPVPIIIFCVDAIGRKYCIVATTCTSLMSWILTASASTLSVLYVARFLAGCASVMAFVAVPMYITEIARKKVRGILVTFALVMFLFGVLLIYAVAPFTAIYVPPIIAILFLLSQLFILIFLPKSPYYLISKSELETAENALNILRRNKNNKEEFQAICAAVNRQQHEKGRPIDLFLIQSNRKALFLVTFLTSTQNFAGYSAIIMNVHTILQAAESIYFDSSFNAIVFSFVMLLSTLISSFLIDRCGRQVLIIISCISSGILLFIIAIYFNLKNSNFNLNVVTWIPTAALIFYAAAFKSGLGIVKVVSSELFPIKVKAMGMAAAEMGFYMFGLLSVKLFEDLSDHYGYHAVFYIFGSYCLISAALLAVFLPETKNKTLEEIQLMLKNQYQVIPTH